MSKFKLILIIILLSLWGCTTKNEWVKETQLTFDTNNHSLDNNDNFSPDGQWLVYDTRKKDGGIRMGQTIEKVNINSKQIVIVYRSPNAGETGPGTGTVSYHPTENVVVFIHGLLNHSNEKPYKQWRRFGMLAHGINPETHNAADARDVEFPFTPGALRGGTHRHEFSGDGNWIGFTYNDALMAKKGSIFNLRTMGVTKMKNLIIINGTEDGANFSGLGTSVVVVRVTPNPKPGSDQINHAADDSWIGKFGYKKPDGTMQISRAFLGTVITKKGKAVKELFVVDIPEELLIPGPFGPLEGTQDEMPMPPKGTVQRRLTWTAETQFPGCNSIVRSSLDGSQIAYLSRDKNGIQQVFLMSPLGGEPSQLTSLDTSVQSGVRWNPTGTHVCFVWNSSIVIANVESGFWKQLTKPSKPEISALVWSPDGSMIAYNKNVYDEKLGKSFAQIFIILLNQNLLP
jgi:hypothetical protein